jgi:hypothetical protein
MGLKIALISWKGIKRICVTYDSLQYKVKTKTFKITDQVKALDFANGLNDRYITVFVDEIHDWAIDHNHPILRSKNMCFL